MAKKFVFKKAKKAKRRPRKMVARKRFALKVALSKREDAALRKWCKKNRVRDLPEMVKRMLRAIKAI